MVPHINKVFIRNYKSIAQASVELESFNVFVGPNGSGKSNFIDALSFVQECLSGSIELAFNNRGGINAVRRMSTGHPTNISIKLDIQLEKNIDAFYSFEISAKPGYEFRLLKEQCTVEKFFGPKNIFEVKDGKFIKEIPGIRSKLTQNRLALYAASAIEEFGPIFYFLTSMRFYSIRPERIQELQNPDPGNFLKPDGSNASAVLKRIIESTNGKEKYDRICRLLSHIVKGLISVKYKSIGKKETLEFKQEVTGSKYPRKFDAHSMSDGTLRILGILLAIHQPGTNSTLAIEGPEVTVHPAIIDLITQVLMDASNERQILITTHSPDIIDHKDIKDKYIKIVTIEKNQTQISPLSKSNREVIHDQLYTPGELLRSNELKPELIDQE